MAQESKCLKKSSDPLVGAKDNALIRVYCCCHEKGAGVFGKFLTFDYRRKLKNSKSSKLPEPFSFPEMRVVGW